MPVESKIIFATSSTIKIIIIITQLQYLSILLVLKELAQHI